MLERGLAHPVLGPVLLVALVLVLAMLFLHVAEDGNAAAEVGAMCLALATVLGLPLLERLRSGPSESLISVRGDRGPPAQAVTHTPQPAVAAAGPRSLPLRR